MFNRRFVLIAGAVVVGALLTGSATQAAWPTRINHLTFNGPVALPGVVLAAGSYTFEAGPGDVDRNVVRVTTRDRQRLIYVGFTRPVMRRTITNTPAVVFGEAPAGQPMPIREWYPIGSDRGHKFLY